MILIHDTGTDDRWCIEDREGNYRGWLECYDRQEQAIKRARNKWAAPGQPIRIVGPNPIVVRKGERNWKDKLFECEVGER